MPGKRFNPRLMKQHRAYSVEEVANTIGAHKNTVRGMIKAGLPTIDNSRPTLMLGSDVRAFIEERQKTAKRPCRPGHFYCFKCREPMPPAMNLVEYTPRNAVSGNLRAICGTCGTLMHRSARLADLSAVMPGIDVQIREAEARLIGHPSPTLECDDGKD